MTVALGINRTLAYKKQSALGTPATGSGGQLLRRRTANLNVTRDTYTNDEIVSHQQSTGATHGIAKSGGRLSGILSAGTYADFFESLLRRDFAAVSAIASLSLTIAGASPYTVTRSTGDYLTGGIKIGDIVRLTGGSLNAANASKNLLVTGVTATVLTVLPVNGVAMVAEGPIASCTVTVTGKKTRAPTSGWTNDYYTLEEYYADVVRSHLFPDIKVASAALSLPATGNSDLTFEFVGLGVNTQSGTQVLTSPTAESTSEALTAVNGYLLISGTRYVTVTQASVNISGNVTHGEAVIGSNYIPDLQRGRISVSGSISVLYENDTLGGYFSGETAISLVFVITDSTSATAEFVTLSMSNVALFSNDADDGEKQIIRTYNFTAAYNGAGGSSLANDATILTIQDSLAA